MEWLEKLPDKDFGGMLARLLPREPVQKPEESSQTQPTVRADVLETLTRMLDSMAAIPPPGADCLSVPLGLPMLDVEAVESEQAEASSRNV